MQLAALKKQSNEGPLADTCASTVFHVFITGGTFGIAQAWIPLALLLSRILPFARIFAAQGLKNGAAELLEEPAAGVSTFFPAEIPWWGRRFRLPFF